MKKIAFLLCMNLILISCQKYEFIGPKEGQSVFLDIFNGKVIYINNSNRVVDYVDLKLASDEISRIRADKNLNDSAQKMKYWGKNEIPGTKYVLELSTSIMLQYKLWIKPFKFNTGVFC